MKNFCLSLAFSFFTCASFAQLKYLDKTFSNDGYAVSNFNGSTYLNAIAVQNDQKIIAAGTSNDNFALVRYNQDGSVDNGFGTNGKVFTDAGNRDDARAVVIQSDGKIIVAGYTESGTYPNVQSKIAVVRYNTDGSLDNSFGAGGKVFTAADQQTFGYAMALQQDGKIVIAGSSSTDGNAIDILLVRYTINGTLDNSFGNGGKVISSFDFENEAYAIALQHDGKILIAGYSYDGVSNSTNAVLARYNQSGELDNSFSKDGYAIDYGGVASALAIQADGKILMAGHGYNDNYDFYGFVKRINTDGEIDASYGNHGIVAGGYYSGFTSNVYSVVIQPDGKAVFSGSRKSGYPAYKTFSGVAKLTAEGKADATFGDSGLVAIANDQILYGQPTTNPLALQQDGKILLGATFNSKFVIARILPTNNVATADNQQQQILNVHLYPNPAVSNVIVNGLDKKLSAVVTISDVSGNIMQMQKISGGRNSFNIATLKPGNYIATFTQDNKTGSVKFIKQ